MFFSAIVLLIQQAALSSAQDYQVADIRCEFPNDYNSNSIRGEFSAKLMKPPGFMGHPLFADDRYLNPERDPHCKIRRNQDRNGLVYELHITDLSRCGTTKKDGYVNVRIWFPQLNGVVLATDQEVIIMCKPASPTIIENRAAGFAGSLPSIGRVTGVVEESPGRLEYEVVLLREVNARSSHERLVDQAVPIGSKLQLRARINTQSSAWKFAKLMEVSVSVDPHDPHLPGHVVLVQNGCRELDFKSIVPKQPRRSPNNPGEVILEFQAFMLDSRDEGSSQLWIHATIKACVMEEDCSPETCLDLQEPKGLGKRKKRSNSVSLEIIPRSKDINASNIVSHDLNSEEEDNIFPFDQNYRNSSSYEAAIQHLKMLQELQRKRQQNEKPFGLSTEVGDNIGLKVIFPEKFFTHAKTLKDTCNAFLVLSTCLGVGLFVAVGFLCFLTAKMQKTVESSRNRTLDSVIKDHHSKYGLRDFLQPPFQ